MRTTRGRDRAIAGPTRFTGPRQIGTGDNPGLVPTFDLNFLVDYLTPAVTFSRASNATQFDSQGRLVWAPANLIPQSSTTGAVVGVIGSGGAVPTGWSWSTPPAGITREVLAVDPDYIIVRMYGTSSSGSLAYPQITPLQTAVTSVPTEDYCGSMFVQVIDGDYTGLNGAAGKVNTQWLNTGVYVNEATASAQATAVEARLVSKGTQVVSSNTVRVSLNLTVNPLATIDITLKIGKPQLERGLIGTPLQYNRTTASAYYGPRFDYDPQTLTPRGLLFEVQRTNLQPTYQGVAGDWSGTFGGISSTGAVILGNPALTFTVNSTAGAQFAFITAAPAALAASTVYTSSVRVKRGNHPRVQFTCTVNAFQPVVADAYLNYNFDTDTLVVAGSALPAPTGTRFVCADGSVILTLTFTSGTAPTAGAAGIIAFVDSDAAIRFAGTTTNGAAVHVFGMQIEAGAFATSLIPTFGTAATRSGDVADLVSAPPWNPTGMTIAAQFERQGTPIGSSGEATSALFYWGDGNDYVNGVFGFGSPTQVRCDVGRAGTPEVQVSVSTQPNAPFQVYKWATRLVSNDAQMYANGVAGTPDTVGTLPNALGAVRYAIGRSNAATAQQMYGWLRGLQVYTSALSNTQLQALST